MHLTLPTCTRPAYRQLRLVVSASAWVVASVMGASGAAAQTLGEGPTPIPNATEPPAAVVDLGRLDAPARLEGMQRSGNGYLVSTTSGGRAALTLDPRLQEATDEVFKTFQVPYGAAVVLSIPDGRVLAMVGRSAVDPRLGPEELALRAWAPAASVFKVVSASALVEAGVLASTRTCYHAGVSSILPDNLVDLPALDRRCETLAFGVGKSQNAILAKLATQHLTASSLARAGQAFGFGQTIPFELPIEPSHLDVPADSLEFARTAAGFWHSTLSPMHGALLAAAIANHGDMPAPTLVERALGADGQLVSASVARPRHVLDAATAREVGKMMELTTRIGTAKGTFNDKRGRRLLSVDVAGKTGTLSAQTDRGYVGYSWFIGFAPADKPTIAFAVTLGNNANWRIKATYVARRIVTEYLAERAEKKAAGGAPRILAAR
jgi:peptidoglycan glycosyltransferase